MNGRVVVTGAGGGIGSAVCQAFAAAGVDVVGSAAKVPPRPQKRLRWIWLIRQP